MVYNFSSYARFYKPFIFGDAILNSIEEIGKTLPVTGFQYPEKGEPFNGNITFILRQFTKSIKNYHAFWIISSISKDIQETTGYELSVIIIQLNINYNHGDETNMFPVEMTTEC